MKKLRIVACLITILMLASCSITNVDSDTLMSPPKMNTTDQGILKAVSSECPSYKLVSPISGKYQTAVIQYDLNGDNKNEALCFYSDGNDSPINLLVLKDENGEWIKFGKYESDALSIDRVDFCNLTGGKNKEVTVGWKFQSGGEKALEVLKFSETENMNTIYTGMYNAFSVFDTSFVIISRNTNGKTASASLIGKDGVAPTVIKTLSLNNSISSFLNIQSASIDDGTYAVYVDEQLESGSYITEVLTVNGRNMQKSSDEINNMTTRSKAYTCADVNGDNIPELPVEKAFPSYFRQGATEYTTYVEWMKYDGNEAEKLMNAYTSINEQFILELPEDWTGNITVQKDEVTERTIHFYYIDNGQNKPMFSIRVFSQQEFTDNEKQLGWISISTSSENVYAFCSRAEGLPDKYNVDFNTISELFKIIS